MKGRIAAAVMCAALAGCAECGGVTYDLAGKSVVASRTSAQYCYAAKPEPARGITKQTPGASWGIAKLINAPVEDLRGTKVAEIDDLLVAPDGRIKTAVLTVTDDAGGPRTITVAFKDLKRSVDASGNYIIRTTELSRPKKKAPAKDEAEMAAPAKDASQEGSAKKPEPPSAESK